MADQSTSKLDGRFEQDLAGKTALVTGATRGIGRATAFHLAKRGASILGTCSSETSMHHIESLSSEITEYYWGTGCDAPKIVGVAANVLSLDTPGIVAEAVEKHFNSKIHILVNNAAYDELREMGPGGKHTHFGDARRSTLYTGYDSAGFKDYQYVQRVRSKNTVSLNSFHSAMYLVGATKATMEALTRSWADILGKDPKTLGTTVNALLVGATATEALLREATPELKNMGLAALQSGSAVCSGMGLPEDIANVAGLLASEKARWITGSVVCANGGSVYIAAGWCISHPSENPDIVTATQAVITGNRDLDIPWNSYSKAVQLVHK
ncbi:hypothetical protein BDV33DRAFT_228432 [Aspergillus novoparasiticus]|uniref:NAD(P)-binding protein n=1 Tax=Aspergillus novoparasiticus TaxID=986946 RepID=A0A5N6E9Z5_9EURO|nr:hypothetical protein BDV33DRAFT_228432 [Aspergillus novoparasiticus]